MVSPILNSESWNDYYDFFFKFVFLIRNNLYLFWFCSFLVVLKTLAKIKLTYLLTLSFHLTLFLQSPLRITRVRKAIGVTLRAVPGFWQSGKDHELSTILILNTCSQTRRWPVFGNFCLLTAWRATTDWQLVTVFFVLILLGRENSNSDVCKYLLTYLFTYYVHITTPT